ncbi:MAG TPA: O-antigen ligase family protein [Phycisphaerae bacterium]|nr:O-antigen ligase family protein [Phycisphaerae bacterium]
MTRVSGLTDAADGGAQGRAGASEAPLARAAQAAALGLLLASLCARVFIGELPFRMSPATGAHQRIQAAGAADQQIPERTDLARVTFALLLLAAAALWLLGRAAAGRLTIRYGWLGALILIFAAWSLAAALGASDKRSALDTWIEQAALLAAFFAAVHLCANTRRFALVVVVLAALAMASAAKGIRQTSVEIPDRIAEFESDRLKYLAQREINPGSPEETMFEKRVYDRSVTGFGALSNVLASLLIVLLSAGAGLAADKLVSATALRKKWRPVKPAEIHLPTLAAIITAAAVAPAAAVLLLTRSRGGIISAGLAAAAGVAIVLARKHLARHRRKALAAAAALVVVAAAAIVAYGLKHDRLPTKTMTFRWFYWTATAKMVRDRPLLGVGPGNFASAYLQYRQLPGGEESVKTPHNAIADAASQYGLPGAAIYLAILIGTLICASRPRREDGLGARPGATKAWPAMVVLLAGSTIVARAVFAGAGQNAGVFFLDALVPAGVLALCLALARWTGGASGGLAGGPVTRIALACGLAGFALHNLIAFDFWTPATATVFWLAAAACLGSAAGGRQRDLSKLRWPLAVAGVAAVVAAGALLWRPVWRKTMLAEASLGALSAALPHKAYDCAVRAAQADALDALAAADAAKIIALTTRWMPTTAEAVSRLQDALHWAQEAMRRDPQDSAGALLAARIELERAKLDSPEAAPPAKAIELMARAVRLDPWNSRLRLEHARMLCDAGMATECLGELREVERIDRALYAESTLRLTADERKQIESLRRRAHPARK